VTRMRTAPASRAGKGSSRISKGLPGPRNTAARPVSGMGGAGPPRKREWYVWLRLARGFRRGQTPACARVPRWSMIAASSTAPALQGTFQRDAQVADADRGGRPRLPRLLVAASAATVSVGWEGFTWDQLTEVLVYPQQDPAAWQAAGRGQA